MTTEIDADKSDCEIPMIKTHNRLVEDEHGYVDSSGAFDSISRDIIMQLPSNQYEDPAILPHSSATLPSTRKRCTLKRSESRYKTMKMKRVSFKATNLSNDVDRVFKMLTSDPTAEKHEIKNDLRDMYQSLTVKRMIKEKIDCCEEGRHKLQSLNCCSKISYHFAMLWERTKNNLKDLSYSIELWHSAIKKVQGHSGSGVASYFIFLRWLLYLNIFNAIASWGFIVTPQLLYDNLGNQVSSNISFNVYEILTASGWIGNSSLFYGHYTNETIEIVSGYRYTMPLAYLFSVAVVAISNLVVVAYSVTKAYEMNYVDSSEEVQKVCAKVFCAWDFTIEKADVAHLRHQLIYQELKNLLSHDLKNKSSISCMRYALKVLISSAVNAFVFLVIAAIGYLVYYILDNKALEIEIKVLRLMVLPLTITSISVLFHYVILFATKLEYRFTSQVQLYLLLGRVAVLRIVILCILMYFWLVIFIPDPSSTQCYESLLGEEIYRLIIVNFLMGLILRSLVGDFFRKVMSKHLCCTKGLIKLPEFDVAYNTNDLIYYQTLVWVGSFYSPMLPFILLIILVLLFYIKQHSVMKNCRLSQKSWSSLEAQTVFLVLTLTNFLLAMTAVGYTIFRIKPSMACGPFKAQSTMYGVIVDALNLSKEHYQLLSQIISYACSPGLIFTFLLALSVFVYYARTQCNAHAMILQKLREQLISETKDKAFLLYLFESAYRKYLNSLKAKENKKLLRKHHGDSENTSCDVTVHQSDGDSIRNIKNQAYKDYTRKVNFADDIPLAHPKYDPGYMMANVPVNAEIIELRERQPISRISPKNDAASPKSSNSPADASRLIEMRELLPRPAHKQGFQYAAQKKK